MVNEIGVIGPSECENFCQNLPDCTWFTYYSDLELCTALTECVLLSSSVGNSISGQIKCLGEPQCNINGRCTGNVNLSYCLHIWPKLSVGRATATNSFWCLNLD